MTCVIGEGRGVEGSRGEGRGGEGRGGEGRGCKMEEGIGKVRCLRSGSARCCMYVRTCLKAARRAMHRALEPQTMPSAYCNPSLTIAG